MKKKYMMSILMIIAAIGLLMTPACKNETQEQLFDIVGNWVFNVSAQAGAEEFTLDLTFNNGRVYLNGIDVGRYLVSQVTVTIEITRTLDTGASVEEQYDGDFAEENRLRGTMSRYYDATTAENFTWNADR